MELSKVTRKWKENPNMPKYLNLMVITFFNHLKILRDPWNQLEEDFSMWK